MFIYFIVTIIVVCSSQLKSFIEFISYPSIINIDIGIIIITIPHVELRRFTINGIGFVININSTAKCALFSTFWPVDDLVYLWLLNSIHIVYHHCKIWMCTFCMFNMNCIINRVFYQVSFYIPPYKTTPTPTSKQQVIISILFINLLSIVYSFSFYNFFS